MKERKKNTVWELLELEPVCLVVKMGRLRWFEHVIHMVMATGVKQCMSKDAVGKDEEKVVTLYHYFWAGHLP